MTVTTRALILIAAATVFSGCDTPREPFWYKDGATDQDLAQARYDCLQKVQPLLAADAEQKQKAAEQGSQLSGQQYGARSAGLALGQALGGGPSALQQQAEQLFTACMEAQGYSLRR
jgi:hypothetical protein